MMNKFHTEVFIHSNNIVTKHYVINKQKLQKQETLDILTMVSSTAVIETENTKHDDFLDNA